MIEAEGLTKRFRDVVAMDDVSFRAVDGRVTGLVGPNGAGKSTTLRVLCTVIKADSGHARVDGVNVAAEPLAVRRQIGALPHRSGLYPNLTARENIAYYAAMQGIPRREAGKATNTVIGQARHRRHFGPTCQGLLPRPEHPCRTGAHVGPSATDRDPGRTDQRSRTSSPPAPCAR